MTAASSTTQPTNGFTPNQITFNRISKDFRTDTITIPTDEMFDLMKHASRGDDVYGEDEATSALQTRVAELCGFEAGLFCVSGTLSNQLAIRTHLTQPPHSILLDYRAHIHAYEAGGVAFHSQASATTVRPANGHHMTLDEIEENLVVGSDIHGAPTKIVALENTLSGMVFPQDEIVRISDAMRAQGVIMHCDGARMWEVAAKTGKSLKELCAPFDSISLCMSKGLGAPIGSVLLGRADFIKKAIWFRKLFGGGIRQSGSLALAASHVLTHHLPLLAATHTLASSLAASLSSLGVKLLLPTETNMLWIDTTPLGFSLDQFAAKAAERGLRVGGSRIVIHFQASDLAVKELVEIVQSLKDEFASVAPGMDAEEQKRNVLFSQGKWEIVPVPRVKRMGVTYGR